MQQFGQALSDQGQHGQGNQATEHAEGDRLRLDRLLDLAVDGVESAEGEVEAAAELGGQLGQLRLQGRDARIAVGQPHPDPREGDGALEARRRGLRRRLREDGALGLVELVDQHRRLLHDADDPIGGVALDDRLLHFGVLELVGDLASDADPEESGHARREGDLVAWRRGAGSRPFSTVALSCVMYSPLRLPARASVTKESSTCPCTTGLASSPNQAALERMPCRSLTLAMSAVPALPGEC